MSRALPSAATPTVQPCASSRSAAAWSSCTYAGRPRVRGHRIVVRYGLAARARRPPARDRGGDRRGDRRPPRAGSSASSRRPPSRRLGLDRLTLTEEQGRREARARISLIAQSEAAALGVAYTRITLRDQRSRWGSCSSDGHAQLQLAARARAARRARLRRRARGLPPRRAATTARRSGRSSRSAARPTPSRSAGSTTTAGRSSPTGRRNRSLRKLSRVERWATFDCYGTLIDWDGGIRAELERVFGDERADELLARYHEIEPELQRDGDAAATAQVLTESMRRLGAPAGEEHALAESLPGWRAVPRGARRARGAAPPRLEARDPLEHRRRLHRRVAGADRRRRSTRSSSRRRSARTSRRTATGRSSSRARARRARDTCTSRASLFHDIVPASELGLRSVWINRLGETRDDARPTRELTDLFALPETLDELVRVTLGSFARRTPSGRGALRRGVRRRRGGSTREEIRVVARERGAAGRSGCACSRRTGASSATATSTAPGRASQLDVAAPGHWERVLRLGRDARRASAGVARCSVVLPGRARARSAIVEQRAATGSRAPRTRWRSTCAETPQQPALPDGITLRAYRDERRARRCVRAQRGVRGRLALPRRVDRANFREFYLRPAASTRRSGCSRATATSSRASRSRIRERVGEAGLGWVGTLGVRAAVASPRARRGAAARARSSSCTGAGDAAVGLGVDAENATGALRLYERVGMHVVRRGDNWIARAVSALRARCPDCRTLTAVAIGPEYQCHSCGREFAAGLVRVPRAWGDGGEAMAEAARMALPWPEAASSTRTTLDAQHRGAARELPERPLVLGGCCCSHVGAVRGARAPPRPRRRRLARRARRPEHARDARRPATRGGCRCGC